jgi:hypothetical protein
MCYTVPLVASIITTIRGRQKKEPKLWWLNFLLYGGTLFGVVDHIWNGELFLISASVVKDIALGFVITAVIFAGWGIIIALSKVSPGFARYLALPKA